MNIKVGDFGLAALIESLVLFDIANGHSFEVDTWSIGVILYTNEAGRLFRDPKQDVNLLLPDERVVIVSWVYSNK